MSPPVHATPLNYAAPRPRGSRAMAVTRVSAALVGVTLPYLARIPGALVHGSDWLTSYFGSGPGSFALIGVFNAVIWVPVVLGSFAFRSAAVLAVTVLIAFGVPAYLHARLDLSADAQAAIGLVFIPFISWPAVAVAFVAGYLVDRAVRRDRLPWPR